MILTYRQRLIIHNLIDAKLTEIESSGLPTLSNDCVKLKEFNEQLLECNEIKFKSNKYET